MTQLKILALAGSTRTRSWNQMLLNVAATCCEEAGAEVTRVSFAEYPLPIFNEDLEEKGSPECLLPLQKLFLEHDGFLIASPEYNSSVTPLLKNVIDWVSRPFEDHPPIAAYRGKAAGLIAASPGKLGGLRGLVHLRAILQNIGVTVVPEQFALPLAQEAFEKAGSLKAQQQQGIVEGVAQSLVRTAAALKTAR